MTLGKLWVGHDRPTSERLRSPEAILESLQVHTSGKTDHAPPATYSQPDRPTPLIYVCVSSGLREHCLLRKCLDLFLEFPFNNLLHHLVTSIVCFVLEHGSSEILTHLLDDCHLVPWLVNGPENVTPGQPDAAGRSPAGVSQQSTAPVLVESQHSRSPTNETSNQQS